MTKKEALAKINKLKRLSEKAGSPQEADTARRTAAELAKKHGISESELSVANKAEAFDDLVGKLDAYAHRQSELPPAIFEVLAGIRNKTSDEDKAKGLETIVGIVRVGSFFLGKGMGNVKKIVDDVLRKHEVIV